MSEGPGWVLPVDKPEGPTSHDVVARARRALGTRRVGHTGTLDPFASGLLLLCVERATRLAEYLTGLDKRYEATAVLGTSTDTDDREGAVTAETDAWRRLTGAEVQEALRALEGEQEQVPPQYSAKKVAGEAMHRRARRGERVRLEPVRVQVHEIVPLEVDLPRVRFSVHCSSGTYVRALARDLGAVRGVGGHLVALRRTAVGGFRVEDAVPADDLDDGAAAQRARLSPLEAVAHLPRVELDDPALADRLRQGQRVRWDEGSRAPGDGSVAIVSEGGLLAIGALEDGVLRPRKVLA